ncbi:ATP-binding protein [Sporosarcina sp. SAFN-015]|uniref:ATP-binding protein n=1 Tax=Sporosarcina sp. SAFN-015 TaxID=3387274 RepID=UPI003F7D96AB
MVSEQRVREICTCRFISNGDNRNILGPPGLGKTHLSIGFGFEVLAKGYNALFITSDELGEQLSKGFTKRHTIIFNEAYM